MGLVPASLPHTLGYACTLYALTFPLPIVCWETETSARKSHPWTNASLGETFDELWSIRISLKTRQRDHWSIRVAPFIHTDQWLPNLSESSGLHRHRSIECSFPTESDSVKRHLSRRHLSVLNLLFNFLFNGGCTCEEKMRSH